VGSSIVRWAGAHAQSGRGGSSLGLQHAGVCIKWYGRGGMRWSQLDGFLTTKLQHQPPPDVIVLQLGSNDLVSVKNKVLIDDITCSVLRLRALLPSVRIIWSNILPRLYWHGANHPKQVDKARKRVNSAAKALVLTEGGAVIGHPTLLVKDLELFRHDGVHLSNEGNSVYLGTMRGAMEGLLLRGGQVYP